MNLTRRTFSLLGPAAVSVALGTQARGETTKLTVLVAQPAGGVTDAFARAVAPALGRELGRVAVVENVAGASGSIAASRLLSSGMDGHMVFVGSPSETVLAPLALRSVQYRAEDFRLLGLLNNSPLALYARGNLPASDLDQLVALGRRTANETLSFGTTGSGSLFHLMTKRLLTLTGIKATHVPYRGGMPMLTDLQSGVIDFAMLPVDALLERMVRSGRMKVLGVASAQRLPRFPAAATFDESQSAPHFGYPSIWVGLMASSAISESLSHQMHRAAANALADTGVRQAIAQAGGSVPASLSLADAARFYAADTLKLQAMAKAVRLQPT